MYAYTFNKSGRFLSLIVENPFEDVTLKLSFESLSCSLKLELHPSAII